MTRERLETWEIAVTTADGEPWTHQMTFRVGAGRRDADWVKNRLCDVLDWRFGSDATYRSFAMTFVDSADLPTR